ncbi:vacuolar fusion protein MON1 homolog B-like, partial [Numida meleagris]|uniref:vacuolar fusion protein MON1 homolog B-like n=1 Tax=Numida meleagris TaxID=8996 RepID=UPI000B3E069F
DICLSACLLSVRLPADDRTLVFEQRGPLLLVSVSCGPQPPWQLHRELALVHEQILSLLTRDGIACVFTHRRGFNLRHLLSGAESVLDRLLSGTTANRRLLLGALQAMLLPSVLRRALSATLCRAAMASVPALVLALVAIGRHLVMVARQRALAEGGELSASDIHLVLNLLKVGSGEVWSPVCLPRFNPDGFFYAYAAALDEGPGGGGSSAVTLILLLTELEERQAELQALWQQQQVADL